MSKHDHVPPKPACRHEKPSEHNKGIESMLRFCAQCDAVECTGCGKEWKVPAPNLAAFQKYANEREVLPPGFPGYPPPKGWSGGLLGQLNDQVLCSHHPQDGSK